jgi:phosphoglycolate phosphatase
VKHGLIFDLDGTLVDSLLGISLSLNKALTLSQLPNHPLPAVRGFIGNGARNLIQRAAPLDAEEVLLDVIEQAFKADYEVNWPLGTLPYDGVLEMLEALQAEGFPLAVLSNKPHPFTTHIVEKVFPGIHFAAVLGQRPGIPHKPDPAGAVEIAATLGLPPESCIMIGDSTMDIQTGKSAGMKTIAVTWGFHDREHLLEIGATQVADTPAELQRLIKDGD